MKGKSTDVTKRLISLYRPPFKIFGNQLNTDDDLMETFSIQVGLSLLLSSGRCIVLPDQSEGGAGHFVKRAPLSVKATVIHGEETARKHFAKLSTKASNSWPGHL